VATSLDETNYKIERWADNAVRRAAYVVFPVDVEDISLAIRVGILYSVMSVTLSPADQYSLSVFSGRGTAVGDLRCAVTLDLCNFCPTF